MFPLQGAEQQQGGPLRCCREPESQSRVAPLRADWLALRVFFGGGVRPLTRLARARWTRSSSFAVDSARIVANPLAGLLALDIQLILHIAVCTRLAPWERAGQQGNFREEERRQQGAAGEAGGAVLRSAASRRSGEAPLEGRK